METNLRLTTVVGRVGQDAHADADNKPARFGVAVNQWNPDTKQEETVWVNCSAFDRQRELALANIRTGDRVWVTGKHSMYSGVSGPSDQLNVKSFGPAKVFAPLATDEAEEDGGWE